MDRRDAERALLASALGILLLAGALRAFFSDTYNANLNALGLGPTAALPLLLLLPALARPRWERALLLGGGALLAIGRVALPFVPAGNAHLLVAALASVAGVAFLAALLSRTREGALVAAGFALGFALDVALLAYGRSADPLTTPSGALLAGVAGALLLYGVASLREAPPSEAPGARGAALALGGWLFLESAILGNPFGVARWNEVDVAPLLPATLVGLALGAILSRRAWSGGTLVALNALGLLAILDHALLHTRVVAASVFVAQIVATVDLAVALRSLAAAPTTRILRAFGLGAGLMVALHFVQVFAFVFAYVPASALWRGAERFVAPVAFLLLALGARLGLARVNAPSLPMRTVATLLAVALLVVAVPLTRAPAEAMPPAPGAFSVLTFNVHQGFGNAGSLDPDAFVRIVRDLGPDVAVLQEFDTTRFSSGNLDLVRILAEDLGYHSYYGPSTREEGFGAAILSRFPILEASWHRLPTTSDNRFATQVVLDVGGRNVTLFGVHLGLSAEDREAQAREVLGLAAQAQGLRLLVGDFNSCPTQKCPDYDGRSDDVYATVQASWRDAWVATGHLSNDTAGFTFSSADPNERIDQVWLSPGWRAIRAEPIRTADARAASDHLPYRVVLSAL